MDKIAILNDKLRATFVGGRVVVTPAVRALPRERNAALLEAVRTFNVFNQENDPRGEHDFGAIELAGQTWFFKIDYYDQACEFGSEDPADPEKTTRLLCAPTSTEHSDQRKGIRHV